jgi:hypothetical protein
MWDELQERKYLVIKDFLDPARAATLGEEFQAWCEKNSVTGDSQVEKSSAFFRWEGFSELQYDKINLLNNHLGIYLLPTYNYARSYYNQAVMERHKDRPGCEISITCHLSGDKEWPIFFETDDDFPVGVNLNPGEAILYLGCEVDHWRDPYEGEHYNQVFLHYVNSRGPWAFCENDVIRPN